MLEMTTKNALGTGWVDNVPGAVSTGYQAQNVSSESVRVGIDTITAVYNSNQIVLTVGGTIDQSGILYTLKDDQVFAVFDLSYGKNFFVLNAVVDSTDKTIVVHDEAWFTANSVYNTAKNGWYSTSGDRIMNTFVEFRHGSGDVRISRLYSAGYSDFLRYFQTGDTSEPFVFGDSALIRFFSRREKTIPAILYGANNTLGIDTRGGKLYYPNAYAVFELNISTGVIGEMSTPYPVGLQGKKLGIACSQTTQIVYSMVMDDNSYRIALTSGFPTAVVNTSFIAPGVSVSGIAFSAGNLFSIDPSAKKIYKHVLATDIISNIFSVNFSYVDIAFYNQYMLLTRTVSHTLESAVVDVYLVGTNSLTFVTSIPFDASKGGACVSEDVRLLTISSDLKLLYS